MIAQHFVGISAGKDSLRTAIECIRRFEKRPPSNMPPRFLAADTGNEEGRWRDYIAYLERELGVPIEIVRADFSAAFAIRRANLREDWSKERRRKKHNAECKARSGTMKARERKALCICPVQISPAVPDDLIDQALAMLHPTGNPFLDLCMVKGRFPGAKSRFCTDELKVAPMRALQQPYLDAGIPVVVWLGERAEESPDRAAKPVLQRIRHERASEILYRPIHGMKRDQVFADIRRAGIAVNPLYDEGASRVGCWPCIMCGKAELRLLDRQAIDRLRGWESIVQKVSRRQNATFFAAKVLLGPVGVDDHARAHIDAVISWAKTSRGGKQFDLFQAGQAREAQELGILCDRDAIGSCGA